MAHTSPAGVVVLALLLAGCDRSPGSLTDCRAPDCYRAVALDLMERDPALLVEQLTGLDDEIAQLAVVDAVATQHPEGLGELCGALPKGDTARHCSRLASRAHLQRVPAERSPSAPPGAQDGMTGLPIPHTALTSELGLQSPEEVPCTDDLPQRTCQMIAATERAEAGRAQDAAAACLAVADPTWRSECFFRAAEAMLEARGIAGVEDEVGLCLSSEGYASRCLEHLAIRLSARLTPPGEAGAWTELASALERVEASFNAQDPIFTAVFQQHLTARAIHNWYRRTTTLTGDPLDHLPPSAAPHVRASLAVLVAERDPTASLDVFTTTLLDVLQARSTSGPAAGAALPRPSEAQRVRRTSLWGLPESAPTAHAQVIWIGTSRRFLAEDPRTDATICILEAAARLPSPPLPLLEEGLEQAAPAVRWTAARLLLLLDPAPMRQAALARHRDEAIRTLAATLEPGSRRQNRPPRGGRSNRHERRETHPDARSAQ